MARPWPVRAREGFTGLPNDIIARALGELTPEQLRLFLGLVYSAEWRPEGSTSPDGRWRIERGQVLASYDGLAAKYGMAWQAVRRALRRFEQVGLARCGRAAAGGGSVNTPADTLPDTLPDTSTGTSPTLVSFGGWFGIQAPAKPPDTPADTLSDTAPDSSPDTIQQENKGTSSSLRSEGAARARRPRREGPPAPEGFQRVVRHWFEAWERAGRGKHASLTQAEGAMVKDLVRQLGPDELEQRMDRAFRDPWFLERGDLGLFRKQVQRFARAGGAEAATPDAAPLPDGPPAFVALLRAAANTTLPQLQDDLAAATPEERDGALWLIPNPADPFHAARLTGLYAPHLAELAAEIGVPVRVAEPAARPRAAAGGAA